MKQRLATPGPTEVPHEILLAGATPIVHHRSSEMRDLHTATNSGLSRLFGTKQDVYTILSSGTGAMEAAVVNCFAPGDKVIVVDNGYFGGRFVSICASNNVETIVAKAPWGEEVTADDVSRLHAQHPDIKGVLVVYSETSTGAINDLRSIANLLRDTDVILVVDAISGLLVHPFEMDDWGIDVALGASHKGFMMPPGLAFIAASKKAWKLIEGHPSRSFYFCLRRHRDFFPMAPSSPAVSLFQSLAKSIEIVERQGVANIIAKQAALARTAQTALELLGFELFVKEPRLRSHSVTSARVPEGVAPADVLKTLKERYGVTVTGGQSKYKDTLIRVGHIGAMDAIDLIGIFSAIESTLIDMGRPPENHLTTSVLTQAYTAPETPE